MRLSVPAAPLEDGRGRVAAEPTANPTPPPSAALLCDTTPLSDLLISCVTVTDDAGVNDCSSTGLEVTADWWIISDDIGDRSLESFGELPIAESLALWCCYVCFGISHAAFLLFSLFNVACCLFIMSFLRPL